MSAYRQMGTRKTPQSEPIPGKDMVENDAGGYVFNLDKWARLHRFLILGSDGGTYYVNPKKHTKQNFDCVVECIKEDGPRVVELITEISEAGRAPKNDPALFALAVTIGMGDEPTRKAAYKNFQKVVRIGTHLFMFMGFMKQFRGGFSGGLQKAIQAWYLDKSPDKLAYQVVKYRQRENWTHRDVLRLVRPKADDTMVNRILQFATHPDKVSSDEYGPLIMEGFYAAQAALDVDQTVDVLKVYSDLPREALKTEHLNSSKVQMQLLENGMPMTALVRNLGNFSKSGLLTPMSDAERLVCEQLTNTEALHKSRIHPLNILVALKTYASGRGFRGAGIWNVSARVVDALDTAFYEAFKNVEPSNKRTLLALDVSSSMSSAVIGNMNISAAEASCAMAMVTARTEMQHMMVAFTSERGYAWQSGLTVLNFSPRQRLDDLVREMQGMNFGSTDCAMPMVAALQQGWIVDTFIIYTDNETWAGTIQPVQALNEYRNKMGVPAKLIVVGMTSNGFTIADPSDAGMMDVVGFDTTVPNLLTEFAKS